MGGETGGDMDCYITGLRFSIGRLSQAPLNLGAFNQ
jgi:hypothetical protein